MQTSPKCIKVRRLNGKLVAAVCNSDKDTLDAVIDVNVIEARNYFISQGDERRTNS